jgi:hypothetical protein
MSLGGSSPSDGSDPLSQAVNRLTKQTGALFVIAAGNAGREDRMLYLDWARAWDSVGNAVTQEVIRAYGLR